MNKSWIWNECHKIASNLCMELKLFKLCSRIWIWNCRLNVGLLYSKSRTSLCFFMMIKKMGFIFSYLYLSVSQGHADGDGGFAGGRELGAGSRESPLCSAAGGLGWMERLGAGLSAQSRPTQILYWQILRYVTTDKRSESLMKCAHEDQVNDLVVTWDTVILLHLCDGLT